MENLDSYDELKNKMISTMKKTSTEVLGDKPTPTTPQEIPELFYGWNKPLSKAVQGALWIAKENNLIPEDSPLRQIWYAFIKLIFQNAAPEKRVKNPESSFYNSFADIIKKGDLYYKDFNVLNDPAASQIPDNYYESYIYFPNTLIGLEKESYFGVFKKFANLLGVHLYAGGGQPSLSASEEVARRVSEKLPSEDLRIYTISDYDPAGMDIANTFKEHFEEYLGRKGRQVMSTRIAPNPEHYTDDELRQAIYTVAQANKARWKALQDERDSYNLGNTDGMEVESLPAIPFDRQMPSGMNAEDAVGQARMRLIVYDKLVEDNDMGEVLRNFMKKTFITAPSAEAETIVEEAIGLNDLQSKRYEITEKLERIDGLIKADLAGDIDDLATDIREWRKDTIEEWKDDDEKIDLFEDNLRRAVARNQNQDDFRYRFRRHYPTIPDTFTEWEAPLKSKELVDAHEEYYDKLIKELDEKIEELTPEEDYDEEEYDDEY